YTPQLLYDLIIGVVDWFFFFQAEDGIRDFHVTGVQTCALPISSARVSRLESAVRYRSMARSGRPSARSQSATTARWESRPDIRRSEERRVGKECGSRWMDSSICKTHNKQLSVSVELVHNLERRL